MKKMLYRRPEREKLKCRRYYPIRNQNVAQRGGEEAGISFDLGRYAETADIRV
jgi:hypothetical protein